MAEFNPNSSRISEEARDVWIRADVSDDLAIIPGCGPASIKRLNESGVWTTWQLFAVFLALKGPRVGSVELCQRFFLKISEDFGVRPQECHSIVDAVASKLNLTFPGLYRPDLWDT